MSDNVARCEPNAAEMDAIFAHFAAGRLPQAGEAACALLARLPEHGYGWKALGVVHHLLGQADAALAALQRAVVCLPDDVEARCNLGCVLQQAGGVSDAMAQYHAALAREPDCAKAWLALAECYHVLDQPVPCESHARQALRYQPNNAPAFALLGRAKELQGELEEAAQAYRQALALDASEVSAESGLARVLMSQGELPEAVVHFRQALALRLQRNTVTVAPAALPRFDLPDNERLLWQTLAQLAKAGVHAFATAGSLLGLEREGALLAFDKDLDIALPFSEMETACACLRTQGWAEQVNRMGLVNPRAFLHAASGIFLDLCGIGVEAETGQVIGGFWQAGLPWVWQRITEYPSPLSLHQVRRLEGWVWVLDQPAAWLDALYGDWRTPDPDFDTVIAAYNLRGFTLLTQCYAFARIDEHWRRGALKKALSLTRHSLRHLPEDTLLRQVATHLEAALLSPMAEAP